MDLKSLFNLIKEYRQYTLVLRLQHHDTWHRSVIMGIWNYDSNSVAERFPGLQL